jgi:hypothetical protein
VRASDNAIEIVEVTARTTDTMTVTRAQEGTTGLVFVTGDKFELRLTAGVLDSFFQGSAAGSGGTTSTASITLTASSPAAMTVTPATPGLYVTLPDATTCSKADNLYSVYNAGDYDYGVKNNAGTQLGWIRSRTGAMIGLSDSSTAAGVWAYYGLEKTAITAQYLHTVASGNATNVRSIALDANRTCLLFGGTDCYAIIHNATTGAWGSATLVRASVGSGSFSGVLSATDQVLVCTCSSTTAFEAVTLSISGSTITVNTGTKATATTAGNLANFYQLIPVGSSFVVSYARVTSVIAIRAISVSGTTPTIGAESALSGATSGYCSLFASGSVVRTVTLTGSSTIYCTPFTVSGSTLSAGTEASTATSAATAFRVSLNGNGNIVCHYINGTTVPYAAIFKLTGTTEAVSALAIGTVGPASDILPSTGFVHIGSSKTLFLYAASGVIYANILTDTSGTASAGTEIISQVAGTPNVVCPLGVTGTTARVTAGYLAGTQNSSQTVLMYYDCSGASPTATFSDATLMYATSGTGLQVPFPIAANYNGERPIGLLISGETSVTLGSQARAYDLVTNATRIIRKQALPIWSSSFSAAIVPIGALGNTSSVSFLISAQGNSAIAGTVIQRVECAA